MSVIGIQIQTSLSSTARELYDRLSPNTDLNTSGPLSYFNVPDDEYRMYAVSFSPILFLFYEPKSSITGASFNSKSDLGMLESKFCLKIFCCNP